MTPTHQASAQGRVESKSWTQAKALTRALFSACGTQNSEATLPSDFKVQVKHPISGLMTTLYEQGDVILPNSSVFMLTDRSRLLLPEGMAEDGIATLINMATAILEAVGLYLDGLFASESIAHIPALVYRAAELDGRWVLLYGNEFIELFTGVPLSQLIGPHAPKQLVELIHPEDLPSVLSLYDRTKTTSQVAQFEYRLQGADGHYRWVTEYVQYTDKSGFKQCASIVIPQGEKRRPTQSMALFESVSDVAQDVGLQTGQSFLEHFCRRLYIMCGAERMVLVSPLASGWWQTIVVTETSTVYPNYDFQVGTDDLLDSWALNIPSERLSENKYAELLIEGHRYVSIVPLRSIRETMTACLVLASDSLISRVDILNQYIELFSVRVLREIKQTNAMQQLDQQNRLLLRQKTELTELVSLLGKLEWVQCENEFIRQVDVCLHNAFTLSYCYWCFWQSGEWFRATLPVDEQRHWYEENKAIQEVRIIQQLEKVRHSDNLQVFTVNQVSVWPLGPSQAGYLAIMLDFSIDIPDVELMQFAKNSIALALQALKQRQVLRSQAMTDSLTGLGNRIQLHEWIKADFSKSHSSALMLFDLNRFKEINDSFGHQFGDKLLQQIGPRIESVLMNEQYYLARLGGDEFALYLKNTSTHHALSLATTIHDALAQPYVIDRLTFQVEASVGVAFSFDRSIDSHELLRHADVAMYASKTTGRKVVEYDLSLDLRTPHKIAVLSELDNAIDQGQFFVVYQPLMDAKTGGVGGLEALVRWLHPDYGYLSPAEFIPIAEMGEGIRKITEYVIQQTLSHLLRWRNIVPNLHVAINLSPRVLLNKQFPHYLSEQLEHFQCPAESLVFELTESTLLVDPDRAIEMIDELARLGIKVEIDDFGTGYSSLSYLKKLPISALKIDRSFILDLNRDDSDQVIVSSTINMAHNLGLKTVAEGVEDETTLIHLLRLGCDSIQGYYYAKPMPVEQIDHWLQRNK